jgi:hypothetical protein
MSSQRVWAIDELVRLICSLILKYKVPWVWQDGDGHDGLMLDSWSRRTLAKGALVLNRFISRIVVEVLWEDLDSLGPLCALLPSKYCRKAGPDGPRHVSRLSHYTYWITFEFLME